MITVLLGTNPYSFNRLIKPMDQLAGKYGWKVFAQLGNTDYIPQHMDYADFVPREKLLRTMQASEVIVCQGGFGSIRDALACEKPVVAVPRMPEYGESPDAQEEMVREMEKEGYIIAVYDIKDLEAAIENARTFTPKPVPASRVPKIIADFLDESI